MLQIAVLDDCPEEVRPLTNLLAEQGFECSIFATRRELFQSLRTQTYDVLLMDWNMPEMDGIDVIRSLDQDFDFKIPIIMLTGRDSKNDIITSFESGVTDYITKFDDLDVAAARIKAVCRKKDARWQGNICNFERFQLNRLNNTVKFDDTEVELRRKEFDLAVLFLENANKPLARSYLLKRIWSSEADLDSRTLDVHVSRIRAKLDLRPGRGYTLRTIFGFGYQLDSTEGPNA